jgi:hypothetical protein
LSDLDLRAGWRELEDKKGEGFKMNTEELIRKLQGLGIKLLLVDKDTFILRPGSKVPKEWIPEIRKRKPEILAYLQRQNSRSPSSSVARQEGEPTESPAKAFKSPQKAGDLGDSLQTVPSCENAIERQSEAFTSLLRQPSQGNPGEAAGAGKASLGEPEAPLRPHQPSPAPPSGDDIAQPPPQPGESADSAPGIEAAFSLWVLAYQCNWPRLQLQPGISIPQGIIPWTLFVWSICGVNDAPPSPATRWERYRQALQALQNLRRDVTPCAMTSQAV